MTTRTKTKRTDWMKNLRGKNVMIRTADGFLIGTVRNVYTRMIELMQSDPETGDYFFHKNEVVMVL